MPSARSRADFEFDDSTSPARVLIPGAYERNTLTHRQPGSIGGHHAGVESMPAGSSTMSDATVLEREKEGGGGVSQRPHHNKAA